MKFTVPSAVAAVLCVALLPGSSASLLRLPEDSSFGDRSAARGGGRPVVEEASVASLKKGKSSKSAKSTKSSKSEKECRVECEADYCPDDGSCIPKCEECCTPDFTCDDSDFPSGGGGGDRDERCFLKSSGGKDYCRAGEFCKVGDYACSEESDPSGRCREVLGDEAPCPRIVSPVCGCDGNTYDNKCLAYAAGVNVAKNDACELPGNGGEQCYLDDDVCTPGLFCRVGNYACGEEDNPKGRCAPKPEGCTYELREVCGCDGKTYSNPCSAYAAGVNIEKNEPCRKESSLGDACYFDGGNEACGDGLFCKVRDYYCKYEVNPEGVCRYEPRDVSCTYQSEPVCGCDCKTYGNKCAAHAAGANIYANSACPRVCEYPGELPMLSE